MSKEDDVKSPLATFWRTVKEDHIRVHRTLNLYLGYFGLGLCMSIPGPTLPDLQRKIGSDTTTMGYVIAARSIGYCVGSLAGGFLYNRFHRLLFFTILLLASGLTNLSIPFQSDLVLFFIAMTVTGMILGAIDTGGNVLCLDLWQSNPGPFFQALHFHFGLGSVIAPLIAEPFLSPEDEGNADTNGTVWNATTTQAPPEDLGNMPMAYGIISAFVFMVSLSALVSFLMDRTEIRSNTEKERISNQVPGKSLPRWLIGFGIVFLASYVGLESTYAAFLTTFVTRSNLKLSKSEGSFMTSVFWGAYCLVRGASIYGATKIKPLYMLFFNLTFITLSGVVLSIWGDSHPWVMWCGSAVLGMGCASTWPSSLSWMENYIGISNLTSAVFVVAGSFGGSVFSMLIGYFMDFMPSLFLYTIALCSVICLCAFFAQLKVVSVVKQNRDRDISTSSVQYLDKTDRFA